MDSPCGETMCANASDDVDVYYDVQRRRRELQSLEQRMSVRYSAEVAHPKNS
jgi:hypothetical protein